MGRKSKISKKQNGDKCRQKKDIQEKEIRENSPIVWNEEGKKKNKEEEGRLDQGRDKTDKKDAFRNGIDRDKEEAAKVVKARLFTEEETESKEVWDIIRVIPIAKANIECRYEHCSGQAVAIWASDKHPEDKWSLCEKCQLEEFGGWPDDVEPIERNDDITAMVTRIDTMGDEIATVEKKIAIPISEAMIKTNATVVSSTGLCKDDNENAVQRTAGKLDIAPTEKDIEPLEQKYELSGIIPLEKLLGNPTKCSDDTCDLPACSVWTSTNDPKKWYYCIDCQERDFDGWPPSNELPCDYLQPEHVCAIATKCSRKRNPVMPVINSKFVTPPHKRSLTPKGTASLLHVDHERSKAYIPKVSHAAVARHEKWQADAKKLGVSRIIVRKSEAKKVIFDALYDAFRPINFNCIYTMLKKMIPPPVLKAALEDMSLDWRDDETFEESDADSNDDDDDNKEGSLKKMGSFMKEPYTGSLIFKAGKNVASSLYYVDHTKIKELNNEDREGMNARVSNTKAEHAHLELSLKQAEAKISQLLAEPMNDELIQLSSELENNVAILYKKVKDAKVLLINESPKKSLKRRIQSMAGHYRKRKQLCCSFLSSLEEISDGTISKKKCLAGVGQIALDSDESVNKAAIAYAKLKKRSKRKKILLADDNFVGIVLDSQKMIERVYVNEE